MNMKSKLVLILSIIFFLSLLTQVNAATQEEANSAIKDAEKDIQQMKEFNLSTERVKDLLLSANATYSNQLSIKKEGKDADFSFVVESANKIASLKEDAFRIKDELNAVEMTINDLDDGSIDLTVAKEIFNQAKSEFNNERYDKSETLIEDTYDAISEAEATSTKVAAFADATGKSITTFVKENWKVLLIITVSGLLVFVLAKKRIQIKLLNRKKILLTIKKKALKNLIKNTQTQYFEEGKLDESTYNTRMEKYGELIRDINRQLPEIEEELGKKMGRFKKINKDKN